MTKRGKNKASRPRVSWSAVCLVIGSGDIVSFSDDYYGYYDMYCTNIGDILTGLTQTIYPQISNYDNVILNDLQSSEVIRVFVNNSVNATDILKVVPINKHVSEGITKDNIISLNAQKAELTAQLTALQQNIDTINNTLSTSDFTQETVSSQSMLQTQLKDSLQIPPLEYLFLK